jgi:hypothetical protein
MFSGKPYHIYTLISTSAIFACFYFYATFHFYRDPGSFFWKADRAQERQYSLEREREALEFRNAAFFALKNRDTASPVPFWKAGHDPKICVLFMTVKRDTGTSKNPLEVCPSALKSSR